MRGDPAAGLTAFVEQQWGKPVTVSGLSSSSAGASSAGARRTNISFDAVVGGGKNDNIRFFDHRREDARTDGDRGGLPNEEWEALLFEARRRADRAGHYRYPFPAEYGGQDGSNLGRGPTGVPFSANAGRVTASEKL